MVLWTHTSEYGRLTLANVYTLSKVHLFIGYTHTHTHTHTHTCTHTTGHQSLTSGMVLKNNTLVSGNADSTVKVCYISCHVLPNTK